MGSKAQGLKTQSAKYQVYIINYQDLENILK